MKPFSLIVFNVIRCFINVIFVIFVIFIERGDKLSYHKRAYMKGEKKWVYTKMKNIAVLYFMILTNLK